eukprot:5239373-Prymnesium_polylepis.1
MLVEARIPDGCVPGDSFIVEAAGLEFEVTVPGGAFVLRWQCAHHKPWLTGHTPHATSGTRVPSCV